MAKKRTKNAEVTYSKKKGFHTTSGMKFSKGGKLKNNTDLRDQSK